MRKDGEKRDDERAMMQDARWMSRKRCILEYESVRVVVVAHTLIYGRTACKKCHVTKARSCEIRGGTRHARTRIQSTARHGHGHGHDADRPWICRGSTVCVDTNETRERDGSGPRGEACLALCLGPVGVRPAVGQIVPSWTRAANGRFHLPFFRLSPSFASFLLSLLPSFFLIAVPIHQLDLSFHHPFVYLFTPSQPPHSCIPPPLSPLGHLFIPPPVPSNLPSMTTPSSSCSLTEFCSWATSQGVISSLVPKESKGKGIGLFVPADLLSTDQDQNQNQNQNKDDADLLFVPSTLLLSRSKVVTTDCPPLLKTLDLVGLNLVTERLALILFLLYGRLCATQSPQGARSILDELPAGQKSKIFWPYIASLPEVSTPVTLEPEIVRGYLAGTLLLDSVCAKRVKLEGEFEHLSGNMGAFEHWPASPTLSDFIWADATFWSRVLSFQSQWEGVDFQDDIPDDMHMVPFLDFANHASTPNIRWQVGKDGLHVVDNGLQQRRRSFEDTPCSHREVFLSYGSKPNTELL